MKDKESLAENGHSLVKNDSTGFHAKISAQNSEAADSHPVWKAVFNKNTLLSLT